jgi:hypothetical protein
VHHHLGELEQILGMLHVCGCDVRDFVTFPSSDLAYSTKSSSTNIPDRHVVNPVTSSKLSTVNYNTSTPFSSTVPVEILDSIPPSWLFWQLSGVLLWRTPIRNPESGHPLLFERRCSSYRGYRMCAVFSGPDMGQE